ncbi:MAG: helix-turn-helix transcriptional regulator [Bacteroidetes bacterium]|nr:helix-turn-helix transcriptional regulator [Bacteroidota bacterium]
MRERREKMRIPQKVLAYELGISTVAYSYIERGSTDLKLDIFKFLCKRLNLKAENFLI